MVKKLLPNYHNQFEEVNADYYGAMKGSLK